MIGNDKEKLTSQTELSIDMEHTTQKMETSIQANGMVITKGKKKLTTRTELNISGKLEIAILESLKEADWMMKDPCTMKMEVGMKEGGMMVGIKDREHITLSVSCAAFGGAVVGFEPESGMTSEIP